jgi:aromatic-amino-acid transaminase
MMAVPAAPSPFALVEAAPRDPILGVTEAYVADPNPLKVNLGVGVYCDDTGKVPLLECVTGAERRLADTAAPHVYLPIDGLAEFNARVRAFVLGDGHAALAEHRVVTTQALGGTGALRIGADFLKRLRPDATVWISDPSWENHRALFEAAGFRVEVYPYYDAATQAVNVEAMLARLGGLPAGSIVVLHACCHNPTGADPTPAQWQRIREVVVERGLIPFLDIAYQGFGDGLEADARVVREFAAAGPALIATSFSKSFSLYGERVGALSVVAASAEEAGRVQSQIKRVVRANYSNPPAHGARVVSSVLGSADGRALWEQELATMRERIQRMRRQLAERLHALVPGRDFGFILQQRGMFSYSGLTKEQVLRLRAESGIYAIESGRICVAALNSRNIEHVAQSIARVLR